MYHSAWQVWSLAALLAIQLAVCNGQTYCSGTQYLSVTGSGEIASHSGAGTSDYQNNAMCYWQLSAPTGFTIAAVITYADFETCCDYVTLYDGAIGSTSVIGRVSVTASSGYVSPTFTTTTNNMWVYFYTNSNIVARGFRLYYILGVHGSLTSSSSCGAISYTNSSNMSGVVTSHVGYNGILPYSPNMTCLRILPKRSGYTIAMSVTALSLASGDCLRMPASALAISSGATSTSTMYCGDYSISSIMLVDTDDDAQIMFFSNGASESSGFSIVFEYALLLVGNFSSVISSTSDFVSHSGVGSTPYSNNIRYYWQITAPTGYYVIAWFTYISLDNLNDVIVVYESVNSYPSAILNSSTLTSNYASMIYSSSSNVMVIRFLTGNTGVAYGFRLQVNASTTRLGNWTSSNSTSSDSTIVIIASVVSPLGLLIVILIAVASKK